MERFKSATGGHGAKVYSLQGSKSQLNVLVRERKTLPKSRNQRSNVRHMKTVVRKITPERHTSVQTDTHRPAQEQYMSVDKLNYQRVENAARLRPTIPNVTYSTQ